MKKSVRVLLEMPDPLTGKAVLETRETWAYDISLQDQWLVLYGENPKEDGLNHGIIEAFPRYRVVAVDIRDAASTA